MARTVRAHTARSHIEWHQCVRGCPQLKIALGEISRELWLFELPRVQLCIGGVMGELVPVCARCSSSCWVWCVRAMPRAPLQQVCSTEVLSFRCGHGLPALASRCLFSVWSRERRRPCRAGCVSEREVDYPFRSAGCRTARCS